LTPLAVSLGEPAGIGPDVILMAYAQRRALRLAPFVVFGDAGLLQSRARRLGLDLGIAVCEMAAATAQFDNALPVIEVGLAAVDNPGQPDGSTARLTIAAIERAVASVRRGDARAVVTAPISKAVLYDAGFRHPGHTEFLAALCAENGVVPRSVMMLADDRLRVVPATIHIPLADVVAALTQSMLVETFEIVGRDLRNRFGIETPRIGVTGLNPHAGEGGAIGREEIDVIMPAMAAADGQGYALIGPIPADTLFMPERWRTFDAVVAMYHDQALIPIKTVAFDRAVNITLGLPVVRTSPDHGTAFDLAGTGRASPASFIEALRMADRMSAGGVSQ
jgi:4-hydroxythreonine-4-phosphate dehydrogenase